MEKLKQKMKIGELAKEAGVNIETMRYYERIRLLPKPSRTESGFRLYSQEDFLRLQFIKSAQSIGFSLKKIEPLFSLKWDCKADCSLVKKEIRGQVRELEEKLKSLEEMKNTLLWMVDACQEGKPISECPFLKGLEHNEKRG